VQFQRYATGALWCERVVRLPNIDRRHRVYECCVRRSGVRRRKTLRHRIDLDDYVDGLCERRRVLLVRRDATGTLWCERVVRLPNIDRRHRVYERRVRRSGLRRRETVCHRWNVDYDYDYDDILDDINIRVWPTVDDYLSGRCR